jgi:hypothetical protein
MVTVRRNYFTLPIVEIFFTPRERRCVSLQFRIDGHDMHASGFWIVEGSVVSDLPMPKEPGDHLKRADRENLIRIWFLLLENLESATAWERIFYGPR